MMKKIMIMSVFLAGLLTTACEKGREEISTNASTMVELKTFSVPDSVQRVLIKNFAVTLNELCQSSRLKQLIIDEAKKEFDSNYDVLYQHIKTKVIGDNRTFEDEVKRVWNSQGFEYDYEFLDNSLPLLNIHVPDFDVFDEMVPTDLDKDNNGLAITYNDSNNNIIMLVGDEAPIKIEKGEIPSIMTFFVNLNQRVVVKSKTLRSEGGVNFTFDFINPVLDKVNNSTCELRNQWVDEDRGLDSDYVWTYDLGPDVEKALFQIYPKTEDFFIHRALLYYGDNHAKCNNQYSEYLLRFKIDPKMYYWISEKDNEDDPVITDGSCVTYKQRNATIDEIINAIWTKGNYLFCFDIKTPLKNGEVETEQLLFSVKPKELFVMNPSRDRRHSTWFRRTRFTYKIHVDSLESKWVYPHINGGYPTRISKSWDLDKVSLYKKIYVSEKDKSTTTEVTDSFMGSFVSNVTESMDHKISDGNISSDTYSSGFGYSNTFSQNFQIKRIIQQKDDLLGEFSLYFDDPIVSEVVIPPADDFPAPYAKLNNLSNGAVTITIIPGNKPNDLVWTKKTHKK